MSAKPDEIIKELSYQMDEQDLRRQPERDRTAPGRGSHYALSRNAGANYSAQVKSAKQTDNLERDGCQLIDSKYLLLDFIKLPAHLRETVVVISGLSGGNWRSYTPIPQTKIAKRMGITTETVRERIEELIRWQMQNKKALIYVRKNDRKQGSMEYNTTEYLPIIVHYAAEYIRRIKAKGLPPVQRQQAITEQTEKVYEDISEEVYTDVVSEMPEAQILIPRQHQNRPKNVTPEQGKLNIIQNGIDKIVREFADLRKRVADQSYSAQEVWEEAILKSEKVYFG